MKRSRKLICVGIPLLIVICVGVVLTRYRSVSFPVPDQNSYRDFLQAAALLHGEAQDYSKQPALQLFVSQNRETYAMVRSGLGRTCRVPIEVSQQWAAKHHGDEVPLLKQLTHGMIAKAKLAELEGQTEAAFEAYTEAYRFADAIGRGGLSLDFLNSISCRALILRHCESLLPSLMPEQRAEFLRLIQRSEAEQEATSAVAKRTDQWQLATFGLRGQSERWRRLLREAWQTRSWTPFATQRSILAGKKFLYEQQYEKAVCDRLRAAEDPNETGTEQDGAANGSQPFRSETNSTSAAAGSRR